MWEYNHTDELYHHGVKGMKWGVKKAREMHIKALERKRKADRNKYVKDQIKRNILSTGKPEDMLRKNTEARRDYKTKDAKTAYRIVKQKAKNDPDYKNSEEYKKARSEYGKRVAVNTLSALARVYTFDQLATGGAGSRIVARGAKYMKDAALNKMFNTAVLDATGKVIYRYNS